LLLYGLSSALLSFSFSFLIYVFVKRPTRKEIKKKKREGLTGGGREKIQGVIGLI